MDHAAQVVLAVASGEGTKVWLDDLRPRPDDTWTAVTTPSAAIKLLETGKVEVISLDHDLATMVRRN
jgi:hypothetical protein